MSKILSALAFALLLTGCGNGNDQPTTGTYAYGANGGGINGHTICPQQVVQDWASMVAPACNAASGGPGNGYCNQAIMTMMSRDASFLQGPGCGIPVAQAGWCPQGIGQQAYFDVNVPVLQALATQYGGPASFPAHR